MQHALIDIGNSRVKSVRLESLSEPFPPEANIVSFDTNDFSFDRLVEELGNCDSYAICSVNQPASKKVIEALELSQAVDAESRDGKRLILLENSSLPISCKVKSPERVGTDRLCSAIAAAVLKSEQAAAIVVNSGTAVTIDAVDSNGTFLGGVIFPGLVTSLRSLNLQTAALPDVSADDDQVFEVVEPVIAESTELAISNGVLMSHLAAVDAIVSRFSSSLEIPSASPTEVFLAGGLSHLIAAKHAEWNHVPELVLRGIQIAALSLP